MNADEEFKEKCLSERKIIQKPTVIRIAKKELRETAAEQHKNNAEYFLECAKNLLSSSTPLAAVLVGHFAMEHKSNQLLALYGYKVESHICTQIGLSRIAGRKDLAKKLSDIFTLRQSIGYRMTLKQSEESKKDAEKTISEAVIPFFDEVNGLIDEI